MTRRRLTNGADALVNALDEIGVRCVFGLPGTQNVALFESLRQSGIRTVLAASEAGAGFMANGWYRSSGQPAVFLGIAGPGFAWAVPPLAEAALDSSAVILITPTPPERGFQYDLQVLKQREIATSLGCHVFDISDTESLRAVLAQASAAAMESGPRPVLLQVDSSVLGTETQALSPKPDPVVKSGSESQSVPAELLESWLQAERPVVFAGGGTLDFADQLLELVELTGAAVFTTPTARGVIPENHPLCLRADLLSDDVEVLNEFLSAADFVAALGCRFSHNGTGGFRLVLDKSKLLHVDLDSRVLDGNYPARWACRMDIGDFLTCSLPKMGSHDVGGSSRRQYAAVADFRKRLSESRSSVRCEPVWRGKGDCRHLFAQVSDAMGDDGILVTDTGLHQILARTHVDAMSPRSLIFPSDFQSMGFGLPAAVGAALAVPGRPVTALIGDGSLLMVAGEITTASKEGVALPILVFRDGYLGQIRMQQLEQYGHESATRLQPYDLKDLSTSLGARYVMGSEDLAEQIRAAQLQEGPTVIEIQLEDGESLDSIKQKVKRRNALKSAVGPGVLKLLRRLR
ncbi:MAG: thiamine pyrophosphate-binding protein [Woeseiaceae bacterium]|nr:thiamine pyrophosphate-binding protein [Woeseiaceae bacterium]